MKPVFKNRPNTAHKVGDKEIWESRSPAVVGFIFSIVGQDMLVLAEKRSNKMPDQPGKWVVPCGYLDWDENGWDALRREVYEETSFLIDNYSKYVVYDHEKDPFYVMTEPRENRQNVALNYCIIYDFTDKGLPLKVEKYTDDEVAQVKWINIKDIRKYDWAFEHDKRIDMALNKINF